MTGIRNKLLVGALLLALVQPVLAQSVSLLPNGEQTFVDQNGQPYSSGQVYFYVPSTTTPKTTWSDAGGSVPNSNPVVLDSAGRAVIWGSGSYRQVLRDQFGNTIWDQVTSGLAGTATFPTPTGNTANDLVCMQNTTTALKDCGFAASPGQYPGTATNDSAASGNIGQTADTALSSPVSFSNTIPLTIGSISLPGGQYEITGICDFNGGMSTQVVAVVCGISQTNNTFPSSPSMGRIDSPQNGATIFVSDGISLLAGPVATKLATGPTTIYLVGQCNFSVSTCAGTGVLHYIRVR